MFTRISRRAFVSSFSLALVACSGGGPDRNSVAAEGEASKEGKIEYMLAGSTVFDRNCTTERVSSPKGQLLVVRYPDGGFRRFKVLTNGRGLVPADGFDPDFKLSVLGNGMIEVRSVDDIYRLPAAIKGEVAK